MIILEEYNMKTAIIHDWLDKKYGAEEVLEQILILYPQADLYTLVDFLPQNQRQFLGNRKITTSFIQKLPFAKKYFRKLLPIFPITIEQFDLSKYELIISSSHAVAKGVITHPHQTHICYVNSQMRYVWDMQASYLQQAKFNIIKNIIAKKILHKMRIWESSSSHRVNHFICNSQYSKKRLKNTLGRDAKIIYPPVKISLFHPPAKITKQDYYFTASRLVGYKNIDIIIKAFNALPDKILYIAGNGADQKKLSKIANKNIIFLGRLEHDQLKSYYQNAKAFIYTTIEDFGIVMVESLAAGTPVIAYNKGGATEIITKNSGMLFNNLNSAEIIKTINSFEQNEKLFNSQNCINQAKKFSTKKFQQNLTKHIDTLLP